MNKDKNIFDVITEYAVNEGLNGILQQDSEYQRIQREMDELIEKFHELNLPKDQCLLVDRLVSSHTESGCCYGKIAYQQGMMNDGCCTIFRRVGVFQVREWMK